MTKEHHHLCLDCGALYQCHQRPHLECRICADRLKMSQKWIAIGPCPQCKKRVILEGRWLRCGCDSVKLPKKWIRKLGDMEPQL